MSVLEQVGFSELIVVDSSKRLNKSTTTSSDFVVNLGSDQNLTNIRRVVLKNFHSVNGAYNVADGFNAFSYEYNSLPFAFTITPGQYNTVTLRSALENAINAQIGPDSVSITQDSLTQKLTFTFSGVNSTTAKLIGANDPNPNELGGIIGLLETTGTAAVHVMDRPPKLNGLTHCYVSSKKLALDNANDSNQEISDIIANVGWSETPFGGIIDVECKDDELCSVNYELPIDLRGNLDIQLVDSNGDVINLNNYDCELVFKIYRF